LDTSAYPWMGEVAEVPVVSLEAHVPTPRGYKRVPADAGSFGAWLRALPIRTDRDEVRSYDGARIVTRSGGVVPWDLGKRNVLQCADSAIRLHAEFLWSAQRRGQIAYHFTSGDRSAWTDWAAGERFEIQGNKVKRARGAARKADHAEFRRYLDGVFLYAGTQSLRLDSKPVPIGEHAQAGDFFVAPGSPGHAVVLLDIAVGPDGGRVALVGQGYIPAQDFHLVAESRSDVIDGLWFPLPEASGEVFDTPSWSPFARSDLRRFTP
jgi:hypothetical protein